MNDSGAEGGSPILFNAIKHHRGYILGFIHKARTEKYSAEAVRKALLKLGRLMIDLYYGELTVHEIECEIVYILKGLKAYDKHCYNAFIEEEKKHYRTVVLSDGSRWTLLKGREQGNYIHIHPARYSKNTSRIRATALKTAIYLHIYYEQPFSEEQLVSLTNEVREKYLSESPIKNEVYTTGLKRVLKLL